MEEVKRLESESDIIAALGLARRVFDRFVAPHYSPEGRATFYHATEAQPNIEGQKSGEYAFYGVFCKNELAGAAASRMGGSHIMLLFVEEKHQHKGIARALVQRLIEDAPDHLLTVKAAPNAVAAYAAMGFCPTASETTESGMSFTPMQCKTN